MSFELVQDIYKSLWEEGIRVSFYNEFLLDSSELVWIVFLDKTARRGKARGTDLASCLSEAYEQLMAGKGGYLGRSASIPPRIVSLVGSSRKQKKVTLDEL